MAAKPLENPYVNLCESPIDWNALIQNFQKAEAGALTLFCGTVRNHSQGKKVTLFIVAAQKGLGG